MICINITNFVLIISLEEVPNVLDIEKLVSRKMKKLKKM